MTAGSTAIVFTGYIILEWLCRRGNNRKTICELFYIFCDDILDRVINWFVSQPAFIKALYPDLMWEV